MYVCLCSYWMRCLDIDECAEAIADCTEHATCTNTVSSFHCICKEGYIGDGFYCASKFEIVPEKL